MAIASDKTRDVPMSVRMGQVLTAVKRMPIADQFQLLVKAGLMTEVEARQALYRVTSPQKKRTKNKGRKAVLLKKAARSPAR